MYKLVGIGLGPANLSLAAMIAGSPSAGGLEKESIFLERRENFDWHAGQLFPGTRMQNSFVRDLVTLADPTNRFSFLSFLKQHGRLLQFLNAGIFMPTRAEFVQYCRWAAGRLENVRFGVEVTAIDFDRRKRCFKVRCRTEIKRRVVEAENVVLGTGLAPAIPPVEGGVSDSCFHVSEFLERSPDLGGKTVLLVGSGQSAAEMMEYLLAREAERKPARIDWVTRASNFRVLDTGNFSREFYSPGYALRFYRTPPAAKSRILSAEAAAESGISAPLLERLYQAIYHHRHVDRGPLKIRLLPGREIREIGARAGARVVKMVATGTARACAVRADCVILCTGFKPPPLSLLRLSGVRRRLPFALNADYSLKWNGPRGRRIFLQSMALHSHGLSDPNFTMICHRNGVILDAIAGRALAPVDGRDLLADWDGGE